MVSHPGIPYSVEVNPEDVEYGITGCMFTEICELGHRSFWFDIEDLIFHAANSYRRRCGGIGVVYRRKMPFEEPTRVSPGGRNAGC